MVNSPPTVSALKDRWEFSVDDQFRVEALREAVRARKDEDTPETLASRARVFYSFLISESEQA